MAAVRYRRPPSKITSSGGALIQWYANGGNDQNWTFIPVAGDENYMIQNANSGLHLFNDGIAGDWIDHHESAIHIKTWCIMNSTCHSRNTCHRRAS